MAEIWLFSGAKQPTEVEELDERPFADCVPLLDLSEDRYLGEDPTQGEAADGLGLTDSYLTVAVDHEEAAALGWKPGYYPSPIELAEAMRRLGLDDSEAATT